MENSSFLILLQHRKGAIGKCHIIKNGKCTTTLPILRKHSEPVQAKRGRGVDVNPAANVKTVARLKSMGDGWSAQIGLAVVVVTQRRGVGSVVYAKASGASRRPYR